MRAGMGSPAPSIETRFVALLLHGHVSQMLDEIEFLAAGRARTQGTPPQPDDIVGALGFSHAGDEAAQGFGGRIAAIPDRISPGIAAPRSSASPPCLSVSSKWLKPPAPRS